jgi:glycine/D-amino acid oxidase-like deaminating enzyme
MKFTAVGPDRSEMTITFTGGPVRATVVVVAAGAADDDAAVPPELAPQPAARTLATTARPEVRSKLWRIVPP